MGVDLVKLKASYIDEAKRYQPKSIQVMTKALNISWVFGWLLLINMIYMLLVVGFIFNDMLEKTTLNKVLIESLTVGYMFVSIVLIIKVFQQFFRYFKSRYAISVYLGGVILKPLNNVEYDHVSTVLDIYPALASHIHNIIELRGGVLLYGDFDMLNIAKIIETEESIECENKRTEFINLAGDQNV